MNTTQAQVEKEFIVDAAGRPLGRVATEIASILIGKHSPEFVRNNILPVRVVVQNVEKISISEKKRAQKEYQRYSGYPGGQKVIPIARLIASHGYKEVLRKAVYGMLPRNKLRNERMKRLIIEEA